MKNNHSINKDFTKIKVFSLLIIIFTFLGTQSYVSPRASLYAYLSPFGAIFYILGIAAAVLKIVLAVNVLQLKEWARKYLVIVMIFCVGFIFINKFLYNKQYRQTLENRLVQEYKKISSQRQKTDNKTKNRMEEVIKKYPPADQERLREFYYKIENEMPVIIFRTVNLSISVTILLWHLLAIYFFVSPQIKKQFK